jgi:hypothetical protein
MCASEVTLQSFKIYPQIIRNCEATLCPDVPKTLVQDYFVFWLTSSTTVVPVNLFYNANDTVNNRHFSRDLSFTNDSIIRYVCKYLKTSLVLKKYPSFQLEISQTEFQVSEICLN